MYTDPCLALRKASQKTSAAARFTNVPPASTSRESKALDHATVVSTPELAPVSMPLPFPDALQEFRLSTSTQDASSGGHSGAAVDAVTRSGSNFFHGNLFEFFRNSN